MPVKAYSDWQLKKLGNPKTASSYLNAAFADSHEAFLTALRKVAQARQMAKVAKEAGIQRETMYRSLSGDGNPTLQTLSSILDALDLKLTVEPKNKAVGS
jgi:probable addiction module antidote protein